MSRVYIQPGEVIGLIAPADVTSGSIVQVGSLIGVATADAKSGTEVEVGLVGVYELPKSTGALEQGALAYWNGEAVAGAGDTLLGR